MRIFNCSRSNIELKMSTQVYWRRIIIEQAHFKRMSCSNQLQLYIIIFAMWQLSRFVCNSNQIVALYRLFLTVGTIGKFNVLIVTNDRSGRVHLVSTTEKRVNLKWHEFALSNEMSLFYVSFGELFWHSALARRDRLGQHWVWWTCNMCFGDVDRVQHTRS